jgi:transcriptional regulator with XRE-family HTH domain
MGGPGSGRQRQKRSVADCRILDIGELADGSVAHTVPHGEIVWRNELWPNELALLAYRMAEEQRPSEQARLLACYRYWPSVTAWPRGDEIEICGARGVRHSALCPACRRAVRKLYAPPGLGLFLCRSCHDLVSPPSAKARALARMQAILGPLLAEIEAACEGAGQLPDADELGYLGPQESRLACLRLRAAGLSLRQIAAQVGISKSSVGRYLAAGRQGIDPLELYRERQMNSFLEPNEGLRAGNLRAIDRELASIDRSAKQLGLYRHSASEFEVRLLFREEGEIETLTSPADRAGCFDRLCERGQRRLSLELQTRARTRRR